MPSIKDFRLEPDLATGVVPVSRAASALAALINRASSTRRPVIITQKGFPTGVLVSVDLYTALVAIAEGEEPAAPAEESAA